MNPTRLAALALAAAAALLLAACAAPAATPSPSQTVIATPTSTVAAPTTTPSPTATAALSPSPTPTVGPTPTATPAAPATGWTEITDFPTEGTTVVSGIAYGYGAFVAVGWTAGIDSLIGSSWTSPDGLAWTQHSGIEFDGIPFQAVAYSGSNFYAFGSAPTTVWRSVDGRSWEQVVLPESGGDLGTFNAFTGGSVMDAASAGGLVYAAGDAETMSGDIACSCVSAWRSGNGTDWTQSVVAEDDSSQAFAVLPDRALVIGYGDYIGRTLRESTDFDTWTAPEAGLAEGSGYLDAAASDDRIVAVGYWGDAFDIPIALVWDGLIWSGTSFDEHGGAPAEQVAWAGDRFVAVGTRSVSTNRLVGVSWSSADGVTWQSGPDVYDLERPDPGQAAGDDPFQHRTLGGGAPGFVLAQTVGADLHVWFAPAEVFAPGL